MAARQVETGRVVTVEGVANAIAAAMPDLDAEGQRIAVAVHRLMADGRPVWPQAIAGETSVPLDRVEKLLTAWPGVYRDEEGRVVGFWGHAIDKLDPEYRFQIEGTTTFAWCALDTLFIPPILGKTVLVEATCPVTGQPVSLIVDRNGAREVSPPSAVVSMVMPDGPFGYDVIESFCHRVLFFATKEAGARWAAEHEGTGLLSVQEAFEVGRVLTERLAPDVFGEEEATA